MIRPDVVFGLLAISTYYGSVTTHSDDYAVREYGVTEKEMAEFVRRSDQKIRQERKWEKMKTFSGDLEADLAR